MLLLKLGWGKEMAKYLLRDFVLGFLGYCWHDDWRSITLI